MLLTDYFDELKGKIPYIDRFTDLFCSFEERENVKCTEEFFEKGFLKYSVWDKGAEYHYKCCSCHYFHHNIGFYFGNGIYSSDFGTKDTFYIDVQDSQELAEVCSNMPKARMIYLNHGRNIDLSPIEALKALESIQLLLGSKDVLWDMGKTNKLKVLEIELGISPPSLDMLAKA